jgi:hypothetical protein
MIQYEPLYSLLQLFLSLPPVNRNLCELSKLTNIYIKYEIERKH